MTDVVVRFRRESKILDETVTDDELDDEYIPAAETRYNNIMDASETVDIVGGTYTTGDDSIDLAIAYLMSSDAYKGEFMRRIVHDVDQWLRFEQMAYCIMNEKDPSKVGKRPQGEYYVRLEKRGIPADTPYITNSDD